MAESNLIMKNLQSGWILPNRNQGRSIYLCNLMVPELRIGKSILLIGCKEPQIWIERFKELGLEVAATENIVTPSMKPVYKEIGGESAIVGFIGADPYSNGYTFTIKN